jgi:uncharacterized protein YfaP (DUF2135 family)
MHVVLPLILALASSPEALPKKETETGVPIGTGKAKATITITSPTGGWTVDRMMRVAGTVSDPTIDPVVISINGDRYLIRTSGGRFQRSFPAGNGKNVVTVIATNQGGTSTAQVTTYGQIPSVPFRAVLTSDTDGVYTDLHIYEPTTTSVQNDLVDVTKMAHVYWANTESPSGGTFFLNEQDGSFDQPGYGPYLYIHRAPPRGVYLVAANYWPSGDKAHTVGTLNLTVFEGTPQEVRRTVKVPLATPGTTRALAWVLVTDSGAQIYAPGVDLPPSVAAAGGTKSPWPKNIEAATTGIGKTGTDGGGGEW